MNIAYTYKHTALFYSLYFWATEAADFKKKHFVALLL